MNTGRIVGVGFALLIAVGILGFTLQTFWKQHRRIQTFQPVAATILSKDVKLARGSSGARKPVVEYTYQVDGNTYTCDRVLPVGEARSGKWARRIVDGYEVGQVVEAYYNPDDPGDAFLIREYSSSYLWIIGFVVVFVAVMIVLAGQRGAGPSWPVRAIQKVAEKRRARV